MNVEELEERLRWAAGAQRPVTGPAIEDVMRPRPRLRRLVVAVAVVAVMVGAGSAILHDDMSHVEVRVGSPAGPARPTTLTLDQAVRELRELLVDHSLADLSGVAVPAGMQGVVDKFGTVRGFVPDEVEPSRMIDVSLGNGALKGPAYEVTDQRGEPVGYLVSSLGFIPWRVAEDPARMARIMELHSFVLRNLETRSNVADQLLVDVEDSTREGKNPSALRPDRDYTVLATVVGSQDPIGTLRSASSREELAATRTATGLATDDRLGEDQLILSLTIADDDCIDRLTSFERRGDVITPVFLRQEGTGCGNPKNPVAFVVALQEPTLLGPAFTLRLPANSPHHDERRLVVEVPSADDSGGR